MAPRVSAFAVALVSLLLLGFDREFPEDDRPSWPAKSPCMDLQRRGEVQRQPDNQQELSAEEAKATQELDDIIKKHELWLKTNKKDGRQADFVGSKDLGGADFTKKDMSQASFIGASMSLADLSYSTFDGANLSYADLSGADLSYSSFKKAQLYGADLSCAHLNDTDLTGAVITCMFDNSERCPDLTGAYLKGTKLADAKLGTTSLEELFLNQNHFPT
jgi:uncharacterized protein YjbI with pentapeptide repeats